MKTMYSMVPCLYCANLFVYEGVNLQAYGILGCFRFLAGYYFLVLTERQFVGSICGTLSSESCALRDTSLMRWGRHSLQQAFACGCSPCDATVGYKAGLAV